MGTKTAAYGRILPQTLMTFDEAGVRTRLRILGFDTTDEDADAINYAIEAATEHICNTCHIDEVPPGLTGAAVDIAAGFFLGERYQTGALIGFAMDATVTSVKAGDAQVDYADAVTADTKFALLLNYLSREADLQRYRRFAW